MSLGCNNFQRAILIIIIQRTHVYLTKVKIYQITAVLHIDEQDSNFPINFVLRTFPKILRLQTGNSDGLIIKYSNVLDLSLRSRPAPFSIFTGP